MPDLDPKALDAGLVDDAVHEINMRWGEPWGDEMMPMDQTLVRETAEAILRLVGPPALPRDEMVERGAKAITARYSTVPFERLDEDVRLDALEEAADVIDAALGGSSGEVLDAEG